MIVPELVFGPTISGHSCSKPKGLCCLQIRIYDNTVSLSWVDDQAMDVRRIDIGPVNLGDCQLMLIYLDLEFCQDASIDDSQAMVLVRCKVEYRQARCAIVTSPFGSKRITIPALLVRQSSPRHMIVLTYFVR